MVTLFGIKNCDTVKKARRWLEQHDIDYQFHDFRDDGIERKQVEAWLSELSWEAVVNRRSTTWKQLDQDLRDTMDATSATSAILEHPTLVKRPLLDTGSSRHLGFSDSAYQEIFQ